MRQSGSSQDSKQKNNMDDNMNKYWSALKEEDHSDSFYKTELWLKNSSGYIPKPKNKFGLMKNYILTHKVKFALVIMTALLLAACNMPVTQNETLGHVIRWTVDTPEAIEKVKALPWVDQNNLSVSEWTTDDGKVLTSYNLVLTNSTQDQVMAYSKELEAIQGIVTVNILPLTEEVERPLYSMMLDNVFKIDINAKNMTDAELSAEVERQLKEGGINVETVDFKRDENNHRLIDIRMSPGENNNKGFQLNINDGDQKMKIEEMRKEGNQPIEEFDIKGKTDDQIRQMIKERFKDQNLQDSDIKITRDGEHVSVNINKSNKSSDQESNTRMNLKLETK